MPNQIRQCAEQPHQISAENKLISVWRSSLKTGKRPWPDRTKTDQDRKFSRLIKTVTAVRSSVHRHSRKLKTGQRPVFAVSTGFLASKSCWSWGQNSSISKSKILLSYTNFQLIFDATQMCDTWLENSVIDNNQQPTLIWPSSPPPPFCPLATSNVSQIKS